ncbi:hypothetical protein NH340_JMT01127 [Sarcoptes scabiei]|nr:hypothetical protein NH340_JMT01127 [Sarcoptes scabiei]
MGKNKNKSAEFQTSDMDKQNCQSSRSKRNVDMKSNSKDGQVSVSKQSQDEGKYLELENAVLGQVVVRFPPEASGYLHIGHAKAALLNAHYQRLYQGKLIFRFDDTNPEKEKESFEKIIEGDIELLGIKPDVRSYTSDYFELMIQYATKLIEAGLAYVDDTDPLQMKTERDQRKYSKNYNNSVEKNLQIWNDMVEGLFEDQGYCLRAKIDMQSDNGALRDPIIFRCKKQAHPRTGLRYKVYPTYDFACPIVDSIEGVTHALRTSEYMDRDAQYYWFCDSLKIRKPIIAAYSRLNLMNTVLSKRKLTYFVEQGLVNGWDDPRMPTVRGILRRGLTVQGLKNFITSQGSSKAVVVMDWDKIWAFNRKVIDFDAPRYSSVEKLNSVPVIIEDEEELLESVVEVALHPKNPALGVRKLTVGKRLIIDQSDAQMIDSTMTVTFIGWGNLKITSVEKNSSGLILSIKAKLDLSNKDFKKTLKITWLEEQSTIPAILIYYDNLIRKPVLSKEEDFKEFINLDSKMSIEAFVDKELKSLSKGSIIQIQRKGFFICDSAFDDCVSNFAGKSKPIYLISIPDGTTDLKIFPKSVQEWKNRIAWKEKEEKPVQSIAKKDVQSVSNTIVDTKDILNDKQLDALIRKQGDRIREMKSNKADKKTLEIEIQQLLQLKSQFKNISGKDWKPDTKPNENDVNKSKNGKSSEKEIPDQSKQTSSKSKSKKAENQEANTKNSSKVIKKQTRLGIECKKSVNYSEWYTEVIKKAEMIEYYDVSGCYILRPWAFSIWETIQQYFDSSIKKMGVENCYFPIFISKSALETEKTHIADFAPEVAWVTKSGSSEMAEPVAIRPTSETVMYPSYAKWVQSHRDLPIKLNQWCNVVRWEFKQPTPFLRTREFLWQEGHSAFATEQEAMDEVLAILELYAEIYENLLAIPVIRGKKTEKEKFAGGQMTTTCEAYVHVNGRGIQGATSHYLGQNFSKMFGIQFENPDLVGEKCFAYQNSWGMSTRTIGALVMIHGDDKGLVLPPKVAPKQVVIVPCGITATIQDDEKKNLLGACEKFKIKLAQHNIRVVLDDDDHHSPGWKFNHWELKGVPVRVEIGPKDLIANECVAVRRDSGVKESFSLEDAEQKIINLLNTIQNDMFLKAKQILNNNLIVTESWSKLLELLDKKSIIIAPFCGEIVCEDQIRKDSTNDEGCEESGPLMGAKSLCIPFDQPKKLAQGTVCVHPDCHREAKFYTLFGRSY